MVSVTGEGVDGRYPGQDSARRRARACKYKPLCDPRWRTGLKDWLACSGLSG